MMCLPRRLGMLLLACPVLLMACSDDAKGPTDAGTPPVVAWDGTYTPLEDKGDWLDRGVLAPCEYTAPIGTRLECDNPALFDVSRCNQGALSKVDAQGIYMFEMRPESGEYPFFGGSGIVLPSDGGPGFMSDQPLTRQQFGDQGIFFTGGYSTSGGSRMQFVMAGCDVPEPNHFTGCFAFCRDGLILDKGTFDADRMIFGRGEAESAGGIHLVSESFVGLGFPGDVYVTKNHAYVVSFQPRGMPPGGLTVFDVTDRAHPVLKKVISLPGDGYWNAAWAKDDVLYIATRASGVILYDISNPGDPTYIRSVPNGAPLDVHTLFVDGNRLYAMAIWPNSQTLIFDITSPRDPVLLNRVTFSSEEFISTYPHDAFAYEGRLYINHTDIGFLVTDPSDPMQVKELGRYFHHRQYSHASAVGTFAGRTIAFEGSEQDGAHLRVLDVTDPAHIQLIGEHRMRATTSIHNMILKGTRLYVSWYQEGVRVFDVANPTRPKEVAYFNTYQENDPRRTASVFEGAIGIRVPGDGYVYVVDTSRGLLIFNEP
ncbi:hypothetical protein OV207_01450 [Corallococcus sp. BB11-1]|uniref:LVIVD repeat-containing protein n=1 Tax=Corallococcus sp. BB11-1 TaxID=2996783 RepID=UPI00226F3FAC|nr:hypothetical protein [Corallococcus sp. BB11-1]MCY1030106.1 hypothetical protein [Corallococcus sp. BB11-1]